MQLRKRISGWNIAFNITYLKNKIKSLYTDGELLQCLQRPLPYSYMQGSESISSFYGIKYTGVNEQTGDQMFEDVNKDGVIDDNDQMVLGKQRLILVA
ncbi:MAG: hypothetical protein U0U33_14880 [Chitinophagaceae bacterium]